MVSCGLLLRSRDVRIRNSAKSSLLWRQAAPQSGEEVFLENQCIEGEKIYGVGGLRAPSLWGDREMSHPPG